MTTRPIIIVPIVALTLVAAGCNGHEKAPEPVRPVLSTIVAPTETNAPVVAGTIEPRYKTELGFRLLGRLVARPVNIGDRVEQGQTVAAVDSMALKLAVQSAQADLAKSRAQLANASAAEERQRVLFVTNTTPKATLDSAEDARAGAEASVARAQANLTKALEQLGYADLKADFAGVVVAVGADVGQVVSQGQDVVTVARPDVREAVVDIGPDFPVPLAVGLRFTVGLQLLPTVQAEGRIREIAPQADSVTRMRRVRIALSDPPSTFRLGATITARLDSDQTSTLRVPASAVLTKDGETFVWVVDLPASTVALRKVSLSQDEGDLRVTAGLDAGTRIVTAGIQSLTPGKHVRIEEDATP